MRATVLSLQFVCILAGCAGDTAAPVLDVHPVSGTVKLDGEPAANVTVTFVPSDGAGPDQMAAAGTTDQNGAFKLATTGGQAGAAAGKYRVLFVKLLKPDGSTLGPNEMAADAGAENVLPAVYSNPTDTPMGADVPEGGKTFDFELQSR